MRDGRGGRRHTGGAPERGIRSVKEIAPAAPTVHQLEGSRYQKWPPPLPAPKYNRLTQGLPTQCQTSYPEEMTSVEVRALCAIPSVNVQQSLILQGSHFTLSTSTTDRG